MARVLVVEDDVELAELLELVLREAGHEVQLAGTAEGARRSFHRHQPEIVLLDISLPDGSGIEVCQHIRESSLVPVMFLTARQMLQDKIRAFRAGGDDYLSKPFSPAEVVLRADALLRRAAWSGPHPSQVERIGDLEIDRAARVVRRGGVPVRLSAMEVEVLIALATTPGQPWPVDKLARWLGIAVDSHAAASELIRLKISRLRRKLEPEPRRPRYVHNHRNAGYLLAFKADPERRPRRRPRILG
jgi:DNA-binding response OmpR family regulator